MRRSLARAARPLGRLAAASLLAVSATACTTAEPERPAPDEQPLTLGWVRLDDPVPVDLPSGTPVRAEGSDEVVDPTKPVLVNFWASWCAPCRAEMPLLADLAEREDVEVVGVSLDQFEEKAAEFLEEVDAGYPSWRDPDLELMLSYAPAVSPSRLPSSVLVVDGEAVAAHAGEFASAADLSAQRLRELARPTG